MSTPTVCERNVNSADPEIIKSEALLQLLPDAVSIMYGLRTGIWFRSHTTPFSQDDKAMLSTAARQCHELGTSLNKLLLEEAAPRAERYDPMLITQDELRLLSSIHDDVDDLIEKLAEQRNQLMARISLGASVEDGVDDEYELVITETISGTARHKTCRIRQQGEE